ncbi:TonB-dependent receptor [Sphingomonas bacterium]|uniref:TonB-dependent receptor n=1 Tax=Sphingomonas bacterium TaxID=1895847 RepID=UPI0020C72735|nr:TonB-dependent receptor [Sphingomonas bacterium]
MQADASLNPAADQHSAAASPAGLADIVVTAQRRSENVQQVPIAISAISGAYLQSRDITSIDQIGQVAPNVKIERTPGNKTVAQISIRGSVTINPAITFEPAVGLYVDGVYIAKAQGNVFDVADLERVEVLRGPQGTLYGRNTLAGAVNLVTRKPTGVAGGSLEASYGNFNDRRIKGAIDLPAVSIFSLKVSGQYEKRDGFIAIRPNPYPAASAFASPVLTDRTNDLNGFGIMAQLRAQFSDRLVADYSYDFSRTDQQPNYLQLYSVNRNGAASDIFDPASRGYSGIPLYLFANKARQSSGSVNSQEYERERIEGHALTVAYTIGAATLKSISAYRKLNFDDSLDLDGTPIAVAVSERHTAYHSFSQELQLTGKALDSRLNYVLGGYYFDDNGFTNNPQTYFFGQSRFDSRYGSKTQAEAAYGQVDATVLPKLTLTGGLRYNHETKSVTRLLNVLPALGSPAATPTITVINVPYGVIPSVSYSDVSPAATLRYDFTSRINAYARYAKGFKSGGFNGESNVAGAPTAACPSGALELCQPYRPETVDSYELGFKSRLIGNTLQLNVAAFWDEHRDIQLSAFQGNGSAASLVLNAGAARIRGLELEMTAQPTAHFTANASFAYLDTHYRSFIDGGIDVAGNRAFPQAPHYNVGVGTDWEFAEGGWGKAHLIGDLSFVSSYYTFPYALQGSSSLTQIASNSRSPGRTIVNLRAQVGDIPLGGHRASLSVWVRNLTQESAPSNFIDFGPSFGGLTVANFPDPRTFGATVGVRFR